jgi:4-aminobutyrate aminotransferase-like enzyme
VSLDSGTGVVLPDALEVSRRLLQSGYIALPAGERGEVLALTPPLTIDRSTLERFLDTLDTVRA